MSCFSLRRFTTGLCVLLLAVVPALAGSVSLSWDPVSDSDLAGYRIDYGTAPGSYGQSVDVGNVTSHTISGLADCTTWYFAVKAYDTAGNESPNHSNEINGWPRPVVSATSPPSGEQGQQLNVTVTGTNFQSGAVVDFGDPAIVVNSVTVNTCNELVANISIGGSATPGAKDVDVENPDRVFGVGVGLFTVTAASAPVISSVQATNVGATSADITWDTDEPSDSQVFYRRAGESGYDQTSVDPALVTAHLVTLQGLDPSTTYEYHVRSADSQGNASTSSPDQTFTTQGSAFEYIRIEAEAGDLTAPVRTGSDAAAFQQGYIDTPNGTPTGTPSNPSGTATYGFNLPSAGTWYVWVRVYGVNSSGDSWFESVDGAPRQTIEATQTGAWQWVAGRSYTLAAGLHTLELGGHENRSRADRVLITNDPTFVATETPSSDNTAPAPVSGFAAAPADRRNDLSWTNPTDGDFVKTVIRYRTDGSYPTSPHDGFAVTEQAAAPGSADSHAHVGLTNGTTYYYSAFAIDTTGNVSTAAQAEATPVDTQPPGSVTNLRRSDTR